LLIGPGVEIPDLASQLGGDDAICGKESIGEGCLSMVLEVEHIRIRPCKEIAPGDIPHGLEYISAE
jgi:hypothetical protein